MDEPDGLQNALTTTLRFGSVLQDTSAAFIGCRGTAPMDFVSSCLARTTTHITAFILSSQKMSVLSATLMNRVYGCIAIAKRYLDGLNGIFF